MGPQNGRGLSLGVLRESTGQPAGPRGPGEGVCSVGELLQVPEVAGVEQAVRALDGPIAELVGCVVASISLVQTCDAVRLIEEGSDHDGAVDLVDIEPEMLVFVDVVGAVVDLVAEFHEELPAFVSLEPLLDRPEPREGRFGQEAHPSCLHLAEEKHRFVVQLRL